MNCKSFAASGLPARPLVRAFWINWLHDWSSRTHSYRLGQALDELARIEDRNQSGN